MRALGYALGADGSTMYRVGEKTFFLYPKPFGWLLLLERKGWLDRRFDFGSRRAALLWIENYAAR